MSVDLQFALSLHVLSSTCFDSVCIKLATKVDASFLRVLSFSVVTLIEQKLNVFHMSS